MDIIDQLIDEDSNNNKQLYIYIYIYVPFNFFNLMFQHL